MHVFARLKIGGIRTASVSMIKPWTGLYMGSAGHVDVGGAHLTEAGLSAYACVSRLRPPASCAAGSPSRSLHPL